MKLMNRNNLLAAKFASKDDSRYTMSAILVTENETVATDGHVLSRVSLPAVEASRFPAIDGFVPNGFTRALLPLKTAQELEKAIPKKEPIEILNHAAITTLLKRVCDAVSKFSDSEHSAIRLRFTTPDNAVRFDAVNSDGQELNGVLMPIRREKDGRSVVRPTFKP